MNKKGDALGQYPEQEWQEGKETASRHLCIFLWCHGLVDDTSEGSDPLQLVTLCLAGEEVFPVRGDNGDAIVPREVALCP